MINNKMEAAPKRRVRGRPFVKGDPRINREHGPLCAEAHSYSVLAKNAAAKRIPPDKFIDLLAKHVERGAIWAFQIWRELLIENAPQKFEHSGAITFTFKFAENKEGT